MLRIGILGAAGIAPRSIIAPSRRRQDVIIEAVASSRTGSALAYASKHGISRHFESYDALIADPDIDIVYNALPPVAHARWTIAALDQGKHVLCEKPFAMTSAEAEAMVVAATRNKRVLAEAFHDRYHPLWEHLLALRDGGTLGRVRCARATIQADLAFSPQSIRHDPAQGGGAMMDLGCYPVHWLRTFLPGVPHVTSAQGRSNPLGVDVWMKADLSFDGVPAQMIADMTSGPMQSQLHIEAEHGTLVVTNLVLPHLGHSIQIELNDVVRHYTLAGNASFDHQLDAFIDAVKTGQTLPTGGTDAIENISLIEAVYAAAGYTFPWAQSQV